MRGRPFEVVNKMGRGRPRGSRNRKTAWLEVMEEHGLALVKKCVLRALEGDPIALRLCMERLLPCPVIGVSRYECQSSTLARM